MIRPFNDATQNEWNRGNLQVQLMVVGNSRPIGFCDGSDADRAELQQIAESEGADEFEISVKRLKTGREIWTLGSQSAEVVDDSDW